MAAEMTPKLTPKQEAFARGYVETGNASQAYRNSYDAAKMKPETVNRTAKELLDNPKIAARIAAIQAGHQKRHDITVDRVMREYARLAFRDIRKAFDQDGNLKPIHELDDDTAAAIDALEVEELRVPGVADQTQEPQGHGGSLKRTRAGSFAGRLKKVKLSSKQAALDSLSKILGLDGKGGGGANPPGDDGKPPPSDAELAAFVAMLNAKAAALSDPPEPPP